MTSPRESGCRSCSSARATLPLSRLISAEGRRVLEQERPDLLIVDLRLQGFNGLQLLHVNPRPIPTIVVTGFPDDVLQADARRLGAEYMVKPYESEEAARAGGPAARPRAPAPRSPPRAAQADHGGSARGDQRRAGTSARRQRGGRAVQIYRPSGHVVPPALTLYFPVHDLQLDAELVWSTPDRAGRWQCRRRRLHRRRPPSGWSRAA